MAQLPVYCAHALHAEHSGASQPFKQVSYTARISTTNCVLAVEQQNLSLVLCSQNSHLHGTTTEQSACLPLSSMSEESLQQPLQILHWN